MTGSHPAGRPGDERDPTETGEPQMSTESSRRRGRILLPAIFLGGIALIFLFAFLVSQLGR
ncbi:hypothetical protein [Blastococcus saxobsidens]|uniref:Uncharacterized protein n=1 Tax=Blastococcus saxobsidens TaxID=138336 RepID=A0A4Q7Y6V5_9ACTN|nr:hypothetical protein [Blastococcus saxobsidens]RZU32418.1 hypothetical protein BKA19_2113 [Blastococcus saxobsidens]